MAAVVAASSIRLRAPHDGDLPVLTEIRNDVQTQRALLIVDPTPQSDEAVRAWLRRRTSDAAALFFVISDEYDRALGFTQIVNIEPIGNSGRFGIAVARAHRGTGVGSAAIAELLELARARGLHRLDLEVDEANRPARRLYEAAGFRGTGTHPLADGRTILDMVLALGPAGRRDDT